MIRIVIALIVVATLGACGTDTEYERPAVVTLGFSNTAKTVDCTDYEIRDEGRTWACHEQDTGDWQHYPTELIDEIDYHD